MIVVDEGLGMVHWAGREAVVTLPVDIDQSNADQVREKLLVAINRGATVLIADLSATRSCDYSGADAVARAYQRAVANGTQLRLVVASDVVRRVLGLSGLDRLVSVYPTLAAAIAGGERGEVPGVPGREAVTPSVLWWVFEALPDGVLLADEDGVIVLANRLLEAMFGYGVGELAGRPVETLIPMGLRTAHCGYRASYGAAATARPMADGARPSGLRKDGAAVPVEISLSPVPTAAGQLTLAVIRDVTGERLRADAADLTWAVAAAREHRTEEVLDRVVRDIFHAGLRLRAAVDGPGGLAGRPLTETLARLDDAVRAIHTHVFAQYSGRAGVDPPRSPGSGHGDSAPAGNRAALLDERVSRAVHALQATAADTAALLEQRSELLRRPGRVDYSTEAKRWRGFAHDLQRLAEQWDSRQYG